MIEIIVVYFSILGGFIALEGMREVDARNKTYFKINHTFPVARQTHIKTLHCNL